MKKLILILAINFSFLTFGQTENISIIENSPYNTDIKEKINTTDIFIVDKSNSNKDFVEAKFPNGINAFRWDLTNYFDASKLNGLSGKITSQIFFTIDKDGLIKEFIAVGKIKKFNKEAENSFAKIIVKCEPATFKGEPVKTLFVFPLTMNFE